VLLLSSFAYNFSFILVDYVRPFLVRDLGMSLSQTALLYTCQGGGVICGSFLMPVLVSRFGSRVVVSLSAAGVALLTLISVGASSLLPWASSRFGVGVLLAGCYVSATTMLANFFPPRVRARLLAANMAMFSVALLSAGFVGAISGATGWRTLLWVAVLVSALVAILAGWLLPDDRAYAVYADRDEVTASQSSAGRWGEMWVRHRWRLTVTCLLLAGLNFSGYQFYSGFITTYLLNVRHFDATITGSFVMIDGIGTFAGSLLWGWLADRNGRRRIALAFGATALFIVLFLLAPRHRLLLSAIELGYAVCLSATNCWSAYFTELFPVRLRPMGTSLFHGGHVISLFAPLLVATLARSHNLAFGMSLAPVSFILGAFLWWSLPETLRSSRSYRGFVTEESWTGSAVAV
jgi:predicted MFS family arabinose efflux permease